jgi:hypothetical protein
MKISTTLTQIRDIFKNIETGDGGAFFTHVADDVDWIVEGTHPLAGHYHSKGGFWPTLLKNLRRSYLKARNFTSSMRWPVGTGLWLNCIPLLPPRMVSGLTTGTVGFAVRGRQDR